MGASQQALVAAAAAAAPAGGTMIWNLTTPSSYTGGTSNFTVSDGGQGMQNGNTGPLALTQKCVLALGTSGQKRYFEFKYVSGGGTSVAVGVMSIAAACQNVSAVDGSGGHGDFNFRENGQCFADGGNTFVGGGAGPWVANDIIGIAIDIGTNAKVYLNNTLKFTVTLATTDPTPMISWSGGALGKTIVRTVAADLTYTPPSGYSAFE